MSEIVHYNVNMVLLNQLCSMKGGYSQLKSFHIDRLVTQGILYNVLLIGAGLFWKSII